MGSRVPAKAYHAAPAYHYYEAQTSAPSPNYGAASYAPYQLHGAPYIMPPLPAPYQPPSPPSSYQLQAPPAHMMTAPPLLPTPTPQWDQAAFLQAMNNFAAEGNSGMD